MAPRQGFALAAKCDRVSRTPQFPLRRDPCRIRCVVSGESSCRVVLVDEYICRTPCAVRRPRPQPLLEGSRMRSLVKFCSVAVGLALLPVWAHAQAAGAPTAADIAALKAAVADAKMSADNAWMLVSSALVLMMTGPGLALFYGGLVRKKNVLGTMMQSFAMMALITVLWAIVGYSLCFAAGTQLSRRPAARVSARRRRRARSRLRRHHPAADLHDLPVDVRHHHAGAHLAAPLPSA